MSYLVIPAKAGIQRQAHNQASGLRQHDVGDQVGSGIFYKISDYIF